MATIVVGVLRPQLVGSVATFLRPSVVDCRSKITFLVLSRAMIVNHTMRRQITGEIVACQYLYSKMSSAYSVSCLRFADRNAQARRDT